MVKIQASILWSERHAIRGQPLLVLTASRTQKPQECVKFWFNPLTPELNLSAQRCLTRFFTGDFAS
jgi:hypothetical protein